MPKSEAFSPVTEPEKFIRREKEAKVPLAPKSKQTDCPPLSWALKSMRRDSPQSVWRWIGSLVGLRVTVGRGEGVREGMSEGEGVEIVSVGAAEGRRVGEEVKGIA
jgi:hypothetical protein